MARRRRQTRTKKRTRKRHDLSVKKLAIARASNSSKARRVRHEIEESSRSMRQSIEHLHVARAQWRAAVKSLGCVVVLPLILIITSISALFDVLVGHGVVDPGASLFIGGMSTVALVALARQAEVVEKARALRAARHVAIASEASHKQLIHTLIGDENIAGALSMTSDDDAQRGDISAHESLTHTRARRGSRPPHVIALHSLAHGDGSLTRSLERARHARLGGPWTTPTCLLISSALNP